MNLATYRQFTNPAWDWIIKKKKNKNKNKQKQTKNKQTNNKNIKIALSLGYPSSYFYIAKPAKEESVREAFKDTSICLLYTSDAADE